MLIQKLISSHIAGNFGMSGSCRNLNKALVSTSSILSNDLHPLKFEEEMYIKPVSIYESYKKSFAVVDMGSD